MLNGQEKRVLDGIERQLELSDPRLAESLRTMRIPRRRWLWPALFAWLPLLAVAAAGWWMSV